MRLALAFAGLLLCAAAADAKAVKIEHDSRVLEFTYEWPAQAAAISKLDRRFEAEARREYRRHLKMGQQDKKLYEQQQRGSVSDFYSKKWSTAGESPRLLSLQYQHGTYTGGAHPNTDYGALLWDKRLNREIKVPTLFLSAAAFETSTRGPYCAALAAERSKRRGNDRQPGLAEFTECPRYTDLAIAPMDKDTNGRFDTIAFVASPYTAYHYSDGEYEIDLPVTRQLIAAMKPAYRSSFEAQRQRSGAGAG